MSGSPERSSAVPRVAFRDALRVWTYVGLNSFGGPAGQIAVMHRVYVDERRWVREDRFLHALNYCMLLPGPEAMQLSVYVGWLLFGTRGGLISGLLFVLPGALAVLALSALYAAARDLAGVEAALFGVKAAVLAIVVEAVLRIGKRALKSRALVALAAGAFVAIFFFGVPFPAIVAAAGAIGYATVRPATSASSAAAQGDDVASAQRAVERPTVARAVRVLAIGLALWIVPIALVGAAFGTDSAFFQQGVLASKAAVVTFGGAYAVLAYIAQQAVEVYGWLAPGEMLDGLGLAETTPGPLILVLEFVGFVGAFRNPAGLDPMLAGCVGAAVTLWATFVPCFLWIFLGAPYLETLRENRRLAGALSAITASVVGVILNLAVWFALHVLFARVAELHFGALRVWSPQWTTWNVAATAIALAAGVAMLRFRVGMLWTIAGSAAVGVLVRAL